LAGASTPVLIASTQVLTGGGGQGDEGYTSKTWDSKNSGGKGVGYSPLTGRKIERCEKVKIFRGN